MLTLGTHVQVRLLLEVAPNDEDLDLLGRRGVVTEYTHTEDGEIYGVIMDGFEDYFTLAFYPVELMEVRP